jgi:hypothetical protein
LDQPSANELTRGLAQEKRASFGYHRLTLGQLASARTRPALTAQRTIPLGRWVFWQSPTAVQTLSAAGALGRYANLMSGPGFARAIANVITELRLERIEPDALAQVAPDLRPLLRAYERELGERGFTDWPAVLRLAASAATDPGYKHQLLGPLTFLLDVPLATACDIALVRALCSRSPDMLFTVPANDAVTFARVRSGLGAEIVDLDSNRASQPGLKEQENGSLLRLERNIFNDVVATPRAQLGAA